MPGTGGQQGKVGVVGCVAEVVARRGRIDGHGVVFHLPIRSRARRAKRAAGAQTEPSVRASYGGPRRHCDGHRHGAAPQEGIREDLVRHIAKPSDAVEIEEVVQRARRRRRHAHRRNRAREQRIRERHAVFVVVPVERVIAVSEGGGLAVELDVTNRSEHRARGRVTRPIAGQQGKVGAVRGVAEVVGRLGIFDRHRIIFHLAVEGSARRAETAGGAQTEPSVRASQGGARGNHDGHRLGPARMGKRKDLVGHVAKHTVAVEVEEIVQRPRRRRRHTHRRRGTAHQRIREGHALFVGRTVGDVVAAAVQGHVRVGLGVADRSQHQAGGHVPWAVAGQQGRVAVRRVAEVV